MLPTPAIMAYKLPPINELQSLNSQQRSEVIDHLFEKCKTLQAFLSTKAFNKKFTSYQDFIENIRYELLWLLSLNDPNDFEKIAEIIGAHPRLGATKVVKLSEHSLKEQASLQQSSAEEKRRLNELNQNYEKTFPGLRYVVFVNGRSREAIMKDIEARIQRNEIETEKKQAFNAMCDIALDRATTLLKL